MVLVLGQESDGLSDSTWDQGDMSLYIGGTGKVESLNVSVATGIMLASGGNKTKLNNHLRFIRKIRPYIKGCIPAMYGFYIYHQVIHWVGLINEHHRLLNLPQMVA